MHRHFTISSLRQARPLPRSQYLRPFKCFAHHPYLDRVDPLTTHERLVFVYDLGRYNNQRVYIMGETDDQHILEYCLTKTFPYFKRLKLESLEDVPDAACILKNQLPVQETCLASFVDQAAFEMFNVKFFTTTDIDAILKS